MNEEVMKLKELIEKSERILITSHISPDADAVSSVLLMGTTLEANFPDKQITMVLEEEPIGLKFLDGYQKLAVRPLADNITELKPDLLAILDANSYSRLSRTKAAELAQAVKDQSVRTVIIDHHEPAGKDNTDLYINQTSPAVAQDVYEVLFDKLNYQKPEGYAQTAMTGLYSDTGGFAYDNPRHSATFKLADSLISAGANIELIRNNLYQYSEDDLKVISELSANLAHESDYNYSFISDAFVSDWLKRGKTGGELNRATEPFVNQYLRNIEGRKWGFIVYRNVMSDENLYSVSLRSVGGVKDVSIIATRLGGGGHKPAAGAKFKADSVEQALELVKQTISSVKN